MMHPHRLLRWLYMGRLTLAAGIFGGVLLVWREAGPEVTLLATLVMLLSIGVTLGSAWYTHLQRREPGDNFLYAQVVFDTLVVTAVVHMTGGGESEFAPLYILVIAAGALLLPLPGGVLIGGLASILYIADIVWGQTLDPQGTVFIQIALFAIMALVTGYLGDRLRQAGTALGVVESELRQLRLETDDILDTIDTGVVTVDDAGRLEYANRAACSLLALRGSDWLGRPVVEELERRAPGLGTLIRRTAESRLPARWFETRVAGWDDDGDGRSERVVGVRTTVLERGEPAAPWVTAVLQDVTDGKRAEELNRRAARLEAVAELAASLAHEIKNPLASIRSAVEQLTDRPLGADDGDVLRRLTLAESDRLSRLLSEFIEFSWARVRKRLPVELGSVAEQAIAVIRQHPDGSNGVTIDYKPPDRPVRVEGDEDLIHRAIFNLVLNAAQHAGPSGRVHVAVDRVSAHELPAGVAPGLRARIMVRDSGPGILEADLGRIFDPFFTTRTNGTGLGLSVVHRAVEAHDGVILVDGAPGRGACFSVYLPEESKDSE